MSLCNANKLRHQPWTDIFTGDSCIDRRKCRRTVPMKVLALGVGRTGTASLRTALHQLGYIKTYHMMSASIENPPDCLMWLDALAAKYDGVGKFGRREWDQLLGDCQAVCDWPACAFAKELIEAYPNAKVILTTRDVDSWHTSTMKTVYWRATDVEHKFVSNFSWAASMYYPMINKFFATFFHNDFPNQGKQIYREHLAEVRSLVPPERLLEFNVKDGWEPLCEFLGEEIPENPFPRSNDIANFIERSRRRNRRQMLNAVLQLFTVVLKLLIIFFIGHYALRRFDVVPKFPAALNETSFWTGRTTTC
ncbi:P-loop containing nucleoside triphosphate hydrolase protein [Talaromyces proteolyticus]|uniref:P-loop containing nucleoside triphosphate hydrolase protein n=1 Tax=Talaromyces proteolyticus TaxID=1131652 RepID=A0AAD4L0Z6_9EURO|nr:P-loop containing nucleoside triphosphate hydrolase protein [Talaromyces proteolyticus]KAH8700904.1 P-loop containing nucleoside triphosphate hydrolase protein [Talaromyces proteolyticus]